MNQIPTKDNLKISFCITCKGRLEHLKQTLPDNLAACKDYPNVEFVILDYDSPDGLEQWIKDNFKAEITSGRIRYAKLEGHTTYKVAHAKNMAHRLATGDVLCNLDADNTLASGFAEYLNRQFLSNSDIIIRPDKKDMILKRVFGIQERGLLGCIAVSKKNFARLQGYDETFTGWGDEDNNFKNRAQNLGITYVAMPAEIYGITIGHDDAARIAHLSPEDRHASQKRLAPATIWSARLSGLLNGKKNPASSAINPDGFGCGKVYINFAPVPEELLPLSDEHKIPEAPKHWRRATGARPSQTLAGAAAGR